MLINKLSEALIFWANGRPEAAVRICSSEKVFLKISQIPQENTNIGISFNLIKRRLRCFPVNIAKFLGTPKRTSANCSF